MTAKFAPPGNPRARPRPLALCLSSGGLRRKAKLRDRDEEDPVDGIHRRLGDLDHGDAYVAELEHAAACSHGRIVDSLRGFDPVDAAISPVVAMALNLGETPALSITVGPR